MAPVYQLGDNITWLKGRHSFKGGFEARFNSVTAADGYLLEPRALLGGGTVPVQNITPTTLPGLGTNQAIAQQMLAELSGSVLETFQYLNSPGGANPAYLAGQQQYFHFKTPEFSGFFKDDLKVSPNLTLNPRSALRVVRRSGGSQRIGSGTGRR